jgi:hypothetical protein
VSVALDRRALCRVETAPPACWSRRRTRSRRRRPPDCRELVAKAPARSPRACSSSRVRAADCASSRVEAAAGSRVDGDSALAVAATAAVARALGASSAPRSCCGWPARRRERAGRRDEDGTTRPRGRRPRRRARRQARREGARRRSRPDRGGAAAGRRGEAGGRAGGLRRSRAPGSWTRGRARSSRSSEELVALSEQEAREAGDGRLRRGAQRVAGRRARRGGAARVAAQGRLVAVWAPRGSRGRGVARRCARP